MRHVLPLEFLRKKIDSDLRPRALLITIALRDSGLSVRREEAETKLRSAAKWMARLAALARHRPLVWSEGTPLELLLETSFRNVVESLDGMEQGQYRHREPFHHFSTSSSEAMFACVLAAASLLEEVGESACMLVPDLRERLNPPLVTLPGKIELSIQS